MLKNCCNVALPAHKLFAFMHQCGMSGKNDENYKQRGTEHLITKQTFFSPHLFVGVKIKRNLSPAERKKSGNESENSSQFSK
jgi:hypothetical protein